MAYTGHISPESITTKTIVLKDKAGKTRVRLAGAYGEVKAYDSAGKTRLRLRGDGSIRAYDSAGKKRLHLHGLDGRIEAYDSGEKWRVRLDGETEKISFKTLNTRGKTSHP